MTNRKLHYSVVIYLLGKCLVIIKIEGVEIEMSLKMMNLSVCQYFHQNGVTGYHKDIRPSEL